MKMRIALMLVVCIHFSALSQDFQCSPSVKGKRECVLFDHHPSGPMVVREWRNGNEAKPYKREIQGARSGSSLIGKARLILDADQSWLIRLSSGATLTLLKPFEAVPKKVQCVHEGGYEWDILVSEREMPSSMAGVATEGEMKLKLQLLRKRKL